MVWRPDSLVVFLVSFAATFIVMPKAIASLRALKAGQVIQEDGPQGHASKAGTPTMGGLAILFGTLFGCAWIAYRRLAASGSYPDDHGGALSFAAVLLLVVFYAAIGAADDWLTVRPRNGVRGIGSKPKFLLQLAGAVAFVGWLAWSGNLSTEVNLGFWFRADLGWGYAPLAVLFITGMANFINITDGLDGLAAGLTIILAAALVGIAGTVEMGGIRYPVNHPWLALVLLAFGGACAAFLWYNFNPARVFMGDTGSLAIGAAIPAVAIVTKLEIPAIIAGMVFILDGLSSALQWAVFKYTRIKTGTGRRVFKMSPIHHHFELSGWPEQLVVVRFWVLGALFALAALLAYTRGFPWGLG